MGGGGVRPLATGRLQINIRVWDTKRKKKKKKKKKKKRERETNGGRRYDSINHGESRRNELKAPERGNDEGHGWAAVIASHQAPLGSGPILVALITTSSTSVLALYALRLRPPLFTALLFHVVARNKRGPTSAAGAEQARSNSRCAPAAGLFIIRRIGKTKTKRIKRGQRESPLRRTFGRWIEHGDGARHDNKLACGCILLSVLLPPPTIYFRHFYSFVAFPILLIVVVVVVVVVFLHLHR